MEMNGVLELEEKTSSKGNQFFSVRVGGQYVGNAYANVVKDLKSGDYVTVTFEQKGNFKNVTQLVKQDGTPTTSIATAKVVDNPGIRVLPYPKGYEPHPTVVNEKALYLALQVVNSQAEDKKLTKKSLMVKLANAFELAKPIREFLVNGTTPDGTEELTDED